MFLKKAPFIDAFIEGSPVLPAIFAILLLVAVLLAVIFIILFRDSLCNKCLPKSRLKVEATLNAAEKMLVDNKKRLEKYAGDTLYYDKRDLRNGKQDTVLESM